MPKAFKLQWVGLEDMKKTLEAVGAATDDRDPQIKDAILPSAIAMRDTARALAPVLTGALRKSIVATKGGKKQRGVVVRVRKTARIAGQKVDTFYARFVEFGTSHMPAQPFFRPAFLKMARTYAQDVAPGVKKIVEATAAQNAKRQPGK
jgi:HK97 gp10 family phage protein